MAAWGKPKMPPLCRILPELLQVMYIHVLEKRAGSLVYWFFRLKSHAEIICIEERLFVSVVNFGHDVECHAEGEVQFHGRNLCLCFGILL
jgi:hypothetical protein